ncbi:MAG TPA: ABC transporter permease [Streptosporangiaceae bacterium]|nr:ABC transporter permease [Streptosporangiaceae bacterium]
MFLTYLRRELRRRARQAILISLGLALGIGLVITVTAASAGVKNAQSDVLHSLYGVGTDITVTQVPKAGTGGPGGFGFGFSRGTGARPAPGTKFSSNRLSPGRLAPIGTGSVATISHLTGVAATTGSLSLDDISISGTIPASGGGFGGGGTGGRGFITPKTFSIAGVDLSTGAIGPLSSGKITSGRTFSLSDASGNVAVVDSDYAAQSKLKVGSTVSVGSSAGKSASFSVIGIVSTPAGTSSDVYVPLARAQALSGLKNDVNTVYVAATGATAIGSVQREITRLMPTATVTTASSLASEVTGSLASAASLANNLGKWLAIAVLVAAFALAALLTMAAVARRVREFGTLKALGWRSRRVVGQVMGEALVIGVVGGGVGVALGFGGAALIGRFAPPLTATVGQATGSATPGGSRVFSGGGFPGGGGGGFGGAFRRLASSPTVTVHLNAPVTISVIGAAVLLAVLGGLIAGGLGSWRAARLRPAAALARVA